MNFILFLFRSSLGKKYLMAVSGVALILFVVGHMAGNLQVFWGQDAINSYAALLKSKPALLWSARLGLLGVLLVHLTAAALLIQQNRDARTEQYDKQELVAASFASRTMAVSGLIVFTFVVYHLLHFTIGKVDPALLELHDVQGRHDVYRMIITGFQNGWVSGFYILAVGLLCTHLSHGATSMMQSLGLKNPNNSRCIDTTARVFAALLFLGYISVPVSVLAGLLK
jgi:succinate dehydrogenase / fumarate reductase cytochrome b subunit